MGGAGSTCPQLAPSGALVWSILNGGPWSTSVRPLHWLCLLVFPDGSQRMSILSSVLAGPTKRCSFQISTPCSPSSLPWSMLRLLPWAKLLPFSDLSCFFPVLSQSTGQTLKLVHTEVEKTGSFPLNLSPEWFHLTCPYPSLSG